MKTTYTALSCALMVLGTTAAASGQSLSDIASELYDGAVLELDMSATGFTQDIPGSAGTEDHRSEYSSLLTLETEAVVDEENYSWINLEMVAQFGTLADTAEGVFRTPNDDQKVAHWLDIKRLAFYREILDGDGELILGKEFIDLGLTELNSPADRFGLAVAVDPTQSDKHGQWQAGVKRFVEDDVVTYRFIPFHERGASPTNRNRWTGIGGNSNFSQLPSGVSADAIVEELPDFALEDTGHLLTYEAVRDGYDWFAFAHYGQGAFPILRRRTADPADTSVIQLTPTATTFGGGINKVIEEWAIFGEATVQLTETSQDQDVGLYSIGFSYRETDWVNKWGIDELKPIIEYGGEWVLSEQRDDLQYIVDSSNTRLNRNTILSKFELQVDDEWSGVFSYTYNLNDSDAFMGVTAQYKQSDNLKFNASYSQFNGPDGTSSGNLRYNDFFRLGMTYTF